MKPIAPEVFVRLMDLREVGGPVSHSKLIGRLRQRMSLAFKLLVLLPTVLSAVYFGLIASDRYAVELRYVVRSPQSTAASQLTGILQSTGSAYAGDATHSINAYISSREALHDLLEDVNLRNIYASPRADFLSSFPRLFGRTSYEALFAYYEGMVSVKLEKATGITSVEVQAFTPQEAKTIADGLVKRAEALSNRLTQRLRFDLVKTAEEEVARARERSLAALAALTEFRNRERTVDPTRYSAALVETIAKLSLELAQMRAQQDELRKASPQSPQIATIGNRIRAFEEQVRLERLNLAGSTDSIAPQIAEYERLQLEREFADRLLSAAVSSLETARQEAQRQQVYVELIVTPRATDYPAYPYRALWILATFSVSLLSFVILRSVGRNIWQHA